MEKTKTKPCILWVGEHAYQEYIQLNESVLNVYDHIVLRYSRIENEIVSDSVYFLDEFTYIIDGGYSKEFLTSPLINWLKERSVAFNDGVIIGDASEILMQTFVSATTFPVSTLQKQNEEMLFAAVYQLDQTNMNEWIDLSNYNLLFLKESIPFSDTLIEAEKIKKDSSKYYNAVLQVPINSFSINDFLFYYQDGVDEVLKSLSTIEKLN